MGAAVGPKSGGAKSDINVTPLIDIVLVLLIVFIVMVPGLTKGAKVTVPQVVQTTTPPPPKSDDVPVVITIDSQGKFFLQSDEVQVNEIADKVLAAVKLQPINSRKVTLKVDEEIKYQQAVDALDQVRIASEKAKKETSSDPRFQGLDGGDVKVLISMKKRS